jgi:primosomal protein N' (replication factor Y)
MFQLLTQVAGRAGRATKQGIVYLQTRLPEHPSLKFAAQHDFEGFARHEMQQRKELLYPPFSRMISVQFKSPDEAKVGQIAEVFTGILAQVFRGIPILGPAPATIFKLYDDFRWEVLLKLDLGMPVAEMEYRLDRAFELFTAQGIPGSSTVRINVNVDV